MKTLLLLASVTLALSAETAPIQDLIEAARGGPMAPGLKDRIVSTLGAHGGFNVWGEDYIFVAEAPSAVTVSIDSQPAVAMAQVPGTQFWMLLKKMRTGVTHSFQYYADGKPLGARADAIGYNPDSYQKPGVPHGKVSEKRTIVSKIYD